MTTTEYIDLAIANYVVTLAEDSANPQPDYTLDGKTVNRSTWRESIQRLIDALMKTKNSFNPYIVTTQQWVG